MSKEQHTSNETMATEIIEELKRELLKKEGLLEDCLENLKYTQKALDMIKDKYEWGSVPDVAEAYKVDTTPCPIKNCTENEIHSWEYVTGYEEIMFLINVAMEYCFKAKKEITQEVCE